MNEKRRYVFDGNVIISASLFNDSIPGQALLAALSSGSILLSPDTVKELLEVFARPKFDRYVSVSTRKRFLAALVRRAEMIETELKFQICRDQRDDKYLELAVAGKASCIITGDKDLLILDPFQGIRILTPADFLSADFLSMDK